MDALMPLDAAFQVGVLGALLIFLLDGLPRWALRVILILMGGLFGYLSGKGVL